MRTTFVASLVVALLAAAPAASGDGGPSPGAVTGWNGVLSSNGAFRYVALTANAATTVAAVEVEGGRVLDYTTFKGLFGVPLVAYDGSTSGLSADGSTLVLSGFGGPAASRFLVVSANKHLRLRDRIALRGMFSFDAISPSGRMLYFIQYLPSASWTNYRVRAYDLARGKLLPGSIVDRREPAEKMQGSPVTRTNSSDGVWAYTLYARGEAKAFVHALDTRHARAFCVDLPFAGQQPALNGIRMSVAHGKLVLRDNAGKLAAVDARTLRVKSYRNP
jgi:hypothetical protein